MISKTTKVGDSEDTAFGFPVNVADHKPGIEHEEPKREAEPGHHRFRCSEKKPIPQTSLASRIGKARKGG
jgi:hypothetical protein